MNMKPLPLLLTLSAAVASAQNEFPPEIIPPNFTHRDVLTVDRIHYREDLRNDQVRVLHLNLKGEESVPLHDANDGLFVCLKECHLRLADPGGHIQDIHLGNGQSRWIGAGTRTDKRTGCGGRRQTLAEQHFQPPAAARSCAFPEKNLSTQPVEMLFIETRRRN